jgi:hypothetical protein
VAESPTQAVRIRDLVDRALVAQRDLADLGEEIEDEWTYVNDLDEAWSARLEALAAIRGDDPADPATTAALDEAIAETEAIDDPHRAIDWLSTFPQVVLLALGEPG